MPDIVKIYYPAGVDAFAPQPTPLAALDYASIYAGEYWGRQETLTLQGQLTGCSFSGLATAQRTLLNAFNKSFQTLEIWQQTGQLSGKVYQKDLVEIQSIAFPSDRMIGAMPYTITLTCYPSGLYSGAFGILDPQDSWSYEEQANEVLNVTHSISCKPFNTSSFSSNALDNARNWAFGRTGTTSSLNPIMISGVNVNNFCLLTQTENIDRFNGIYSLTENYSNDLARTSYGVIRYTTDVQSGNNVITVALNGSAEGCGRNISGLRVAFNRLDKTAIAAKAYRDIFAMTDLNPIPLTQSFVEDPFTTKIDFAYSFDNDNSPQVNFEYGVDCSTALNGLIVASIQGTVRARGGNLADKLTRTIAYADSIDLYGLVLPFYNTFDISSLAPLGAIPNVSGRSLNQSDGTVDLNATYDNTRRTTIVLDEFTYTIQFVPSVEKIDDKPALNGLGNYSVVDLGYGNRASITIQGNALVNPAFTSAQGATSVKQGCYDLFATYGRFVNTTLDVDEITTSRVDNKALSFSFAWSFDSPNRIGPFSVPTLAV